MEFLTVVVKVPLKFHVHLHCSLGNLKNLQEMELWHERTVNEIFLLCYCKSMYFKDSMLQVS